MFGIARAPGRLRLEGTVVKARAGVFVVDCEWRQATCDLAHQVRVPVFVGDTVEIEIHPTQPRSARSPAG